jgi:hypothetical protein
MIPEFAFLAVPLATQWRAHARAATLAAVWGFLVSLGGHLTTVLVVPRAWVTSYLVQEWRVGVRTPTVLTMACGPTVGYVLQYGLAALAAFAVVRALRRAEATPVNSPLAVHA